MSDLSASVRRMAEAFLRLSALAADADALQWEPSQTARSREESNRTGSGTHSDPTASTALDERRLELREAHGEAQRAIDEAARLARREIARLEDVLTRWSGS